MAVVACALGWSSTATAATYDVWSCRGPDGERLAASAWERATVDPASGAALLGTNGVTFDDSCDQGGGLSVALSQGELLSGPVAGVLTFRPAPDTRIAGYELARRLQAGSPPVLTAYIAERVESDGDTPIDFDLCGANCELGGLDGEDPTSVVTRDQAQGDAIALRVQVTCTLVCTNLLLSGPTARAELYRSRVTLEDLHPPAAPQLAGAIVDSGAAAGRAALVVASHDRGAGIEAMSLAIDGQPWQTVRAGSLAPGCRAPYTTPAPCPTDVEQQFEIDTGALSADDHEATGTVVDAAGNSTAWGPVRFRVERPTIAIETRLPAPARKPEGPSNGSPAVERPLLRLAQRFVTASAGARVRLRGTLTTRDRRPISGARLTIATRQLGLRGTVPNGDHRATVKTDAAGRFTIAQRAQGARRVTVGFSPRPGAAATAEAAATVRAQLALSAAPRAGRLVRGRLLTLRGRLGGAGGSARGALVQVQAIVNGRWAPVGRTRAGRDGGYSWSYRFVHLSRDTVFRFRTVVEHVPGWPWPTVRSRRVTVRVDVP